MPNLTRFVPPALLATGFGALTPAFAQPAVPAAAPPPEAPAAAATDVPLLTLEDAVERARTYNRDLTAARQRLEQAAEQVRQAWGNLLPSVAVQGKYSRNNREISFTPPGAPGMPSPGPVTIQKQDQLDAAANATVPLLVPWAWEQLDAAKLSNEAAKANDEATTANVLTATAQTYFAVSGAEEVLLARRSAIEVARRTLENAEVRLEAGTATKVDRSRAQLALLRAEQSEREAIASLDQVRRALATLIQLRTPFRVEPAPNTTDLPVPPAPQGLISQALELRPELRALQLTIESSRNVAAASRWRWAPSLSGFGTARVFNYANFAGDNYFWSVGAQLDWVLYDAGLRNAERRLALAQAREGEARLAGLRDTISDDVANAREQVDVRRNAITTALRSVDLAADTLDIVRTQYEAGTATQLDLLAAQDSLVLARLQLAQARLDGALSEIQLRRATGTFPPKRR